MVRDLVQGSIRLVEAERIAEVQTAAEERAINRIVDILQPDKASASKRRPDIHEQQDLSKVIRQMMGPMLGAASTPEPPESPEKAAEQSEKESVLQEEERRDAARRERIRERLRSQVKQGVLDDQEIPITVEESQSSPFMQVFSMSNLDETDMQNALGSILPRKQKQRKVKVAEAKQIFTQEEAQALIDRDALVREAVHRAEQTGIIFVDEIDKIAGSSRGPGGMSGGPDVSREGVQRDILPIIEGSTVNTKFGPVKTDHVLFIAAGAFHVSKPSDLIPELQGRLPIRVELENLTESDFKRILTEPRNALTRQYVALLETEGLTLEFTDDAITEIARVAAEVNRRNENIGARRLHTVLERLLEEVSFEAPDMADKTVHVDAGFVRTRLEDIVKDEDLSRYIL
jgi:ATP-dependent HslUV protease ATP-binding subunit HslU